MRARVGALSATMVLALLVVACGSASPSGATGGSDRTYTIGVLTDATGPAASVNGSSVKGVAAGVKLAARDGYTIKYVVADTGTDPSQVLPAAEKLVLEDHVFAVVAESALAFSATPFLTSHGVPVLGWSEDGPEWLTAKNMFSPGGPSDPAKVATTLGKFLKMEGVTNVGSAGYSYVLSAEGAKSFADSAQAAGLKVGYLNTSFPLGSTNVQPLALAMKSAGVNGFVGPLEPNAVLATIVALRQESVGLKAAVMFTGYGNDLTEGGPGGVADAQGVYFALQYEPIEMHTAATNQFAQDLKSVGVTGDPGFAEYEGYASVDLLVQGLEKAGADPTQASVIRALNGLKGYNAAGLLGSHTLNPGARTPIASGVDNCLWFIRLEGTTYHLVPGAEPLCGTLVKGITNTGS